MYQIYLQYFGVYIFAFQYYFALLECFYLHLFIHWIHQNLIKHIKIILMSGNL